MKKWVRFCILYSLIIPALWRLNWSPWQDLNVKKVIDGDTIVDDKGHRMRLALIDAPEMGQPKIGVLSKRILQKSLQRCHRPKFKLIGKDYYHRYLVKIQCDGRLLAFELVNKGAAWPYPGVEKKLRDELKWHLLLAIRHGNGIWRYSELISPWEYRRRKKDAHRQYCHSLDVKFMPYLFC